ELSADLVAEAGVSNVGACGCSSVGAVVAATKPQDATALRKRMPRQIFLIPAYGAQGGTVETVRELFRVDGRGAIVTASRSVIYAFEKSKDDWRAAVRAAAGELACEIAALASPRG